MDVVNIKLGQKVRDRITGIEGIAIGRTEWLYGCNRIVIQPKGTGSDGKPIESVVVDEPQCEVRGGGFMKEGEEMRAALPPVGRHGAGRPDPGRRANPTR